MAYGKTGGHVTDDVTWPWKVKVTSDLNVLIAQYLETAGECYLATIANYYNSLLWRQYGQLS